MAVVASAPGKVLLTGGYLILERPNPGIVLSTTARFYAIVKPLYEDVKPDSWAWAWADIKLASPQLSRESTYKLSLKTSILQTTSTRDTTNPFVEQALQYAVAAAQVMFADEAKKVMLHRLLLQGLDITILGCNDFYSYRNQIEGNGLPLTPETLASIPPFSSITFNVADSNGTAGGEKFKPEVAKTGLGSSAAMTTAVVAALLHYLGVIDISFSANDLHGEKMVNANLDLVHAVAQTAHCVAQGKVGSGFDVSTAVYGSQRYVRFSPGVLSSAQVAVNRRPLQDVIADILNEKWDHEIIKFSLPPLMSLMLGEPGTGGSSTPSMVGAVKKWQQTDPQNSAETWRKIAKANSSLEMHLKILSKFAEEQWERYKIIIVSCSRQRYEKWVEHAADEYEEMIVKSLLGARNAILEIRFHMQQMGKAAGVPIEPESQSRLLDATMNMEGVLLAGVPGAGGFDAIFAVTLGESGSQYVTESWSSLGVLPLLVKEDPRGVSLETSDPRANQISSGVSSIYLN